MKIYYCFAGEASNNIKVYEHPFDSLLLGPGAGQYNLKGFLHIVDVEDPACAVKATIDVTELLFEFARWCALQVIDLWDAPTVVREYLETGKPDIDGRTIANANIPRQDRVQRGASGAALRAIVTLNPQRAAVWAATTAQAADPVEKDAQRIKFQQMIDAELLKVSLT